MPDGGFLSSWRDYLPAAPPRRRATALLFALSVVGLGAGWYAGHATLTFVSGLASLCCGGFWVGQRNQSPDYGNAGPTLAHPFAPARRQADGTDLVEQMLRDGRYALLLRPQLVGNLAPLQRRRAERELAQDMAELSAGELLPGESTESLTRREDSEDALAALHEPTYVDDYLLDRHLVTNQEYYAFVSSGGYQEMAIWDSQIWPAVSSFVDRTGQLGPRFWRHGSFAAGEHDHPVVGICWYEAAAYARWIGKRLPTSAEWEKTASSPVCLPDGNRLQRRFPWGDSPDVERANLWGSGEGRVVSVEAFPGGATPSGVRQLVGNVWEWTADDFGGDQLVLPASMKVIRGGAFDTYFDAQADAQFQSGEISANRRHNVGFRCALSRCDLLPVEQDDDGVGESQEGDPHEAPSFDSSDTATNLEPVTLGEHS